MPAGFADSPRKRLVRQHWNTPLLQRVGDALGIKYLYFAVPEKLEAAALELAPSRAGIITVRPKDDDPAAHRSWWPRCKRIRDPICTKHAQPMSDRDRYKVARLGALRIWGLKRKLNGS